MTFDPKDLLSGPCLTVDDLAAKLERIKKLGAGQMDVRMPDGRAVVDVELVAKGEVPAHFVLKGK